MKLEDIEFLSCVHAGHRYIEQLQCVFDNAHEIVEVAQKLVADIIDSFGLHR